MAHEVWLSATESYLRSCTKVAIQRKPCLAELSKHVIFPRGSQYPIFSASGSKSHSQYGVGDQKPHILGT